jgi:hypothetical protein
MKANLAGTILTSLTWVIVGAAILVSAQVLHPLTMSGVVIGLAFSMPIAIYRHRAWLEQHWLEAFLAGLALALAAIETWMSQRSLLGALSLGFLQIVVGFCLWMLPTGEPPYAKVALFRFLAGVFLLLVGIWTVSGAVMPVSNSAGFLIPVVVGGILALCSIVYATRHNLLR